MSEKKYRFYIPRETKAPGMNESFYKKLLNKNGKKTQKELVQALDAFIGKNRQDFPIHIKRYVDNNENDLEGKNNSKGRYQISERTLTRMFPTEKNQRTGDVGNDIEYLDLFCMYFTDDLKTTFLVTFQLSTINDLKQYCTLETLDRVRKKEHFHEVYTCQNAVKEYVKNPNHKKGINRIPTSELSVSDKRVGTTTRTGDLVKSKWRFCLLNKKEDKYSKCIWKALKNGLHLESNIVAEQAPIIWKALDNFIHTCQNDESILNNQLLQEHVDTKLIFPDASSVQQLFSRDMLVNATSAESAGADLRSLDILTYFICFQLEAEPKLFYDFLQIKKTNELAPFLTPIYHYKKKKLGKKGDDIFNDKAEWNKLYEEIEENSKLEKLLLRLWTSLYPKPHQNIFIALLMWLSLCTLLALLIILHYVHKIFTAFLNFKLKQSLTIESFRKNSLKLIIGVLVILCAVYLNYSQEKSDLGENQGTKETSNILAKATHKDRDVENGKWTPPIKLNCLPIIEHNGVDLGFAADSTYINVSHVHIGKDPSGHQFPMWLKSSYLWADSTKKIDSIYLYPYNEASYLDFLREVNENYEAQQGKVDSIEQNGVNMHSYTIVHRNIEHLLKKTTAIPNNEIFTIEKNKKPIEVQMRYTKNKFINTILGEYSVLLDVNRIELDICKGKYLIFVPFLLENGKQKRTLAIPMKIY